MGAMKNDLRQNIAKAVSDAVSSRLGGGDDNLSRIVAEEVALVLGDRPINAGLTEAFDEAQRHTEAAERVVISANGRNRGGIVMRIAAAIDEFSGDIQDISQTLVGDYFTMLIIVDIAGATRQGARFLQLRERLQEVGSDLGIHIVALHDDILSSMHSI